MLVDVAAPAPARAGASDAFRWCSRCQNMWFIAGGNNGHCPVSHLWDHNHYTNGSWTFWLPDDQSTDTFGQLRLKWCQTCKAVYFGQGRGVCPNNGNGHTPSVRAYRIETNVGGTISGFPKQSGWRRCERCLLLCWGPGWMDGHCPMGGGAHVMACFIHPTLGWIFEDYMPRHT
ncbi:hypothetical protein Ssi03_63310 [Sphaerisporangium siamense]|nr:hypothetical protein Ssi03_63310 [Sphaerisporangium siamense]